MHFLKNKQENLSYYATAVDLLQACISIEAIFTEQKRKQVKLDLSMFFFIHPALGVPPLRCSVAPELGIHRSSGYKRKSHATSQIYIPPNVIKITLLLYVETIALVSSLTVWTANLSQ